MSARSDEELALAYQQATGRESETRFPDDPDWLYRGTPKERAELKRRFLQDTDDEDMEPDVIEGQEQLFGE